LVEEKPAKKAEPWRALHLINYASDKDLEALGGGQVPRLAEMGVNVIILEVDYGFRFQAYPKPRRGRDPITPDGAAKLAAACRKSGVRLIPPPRECLAPAAKGRADPGHRRGTHQVDPRQRREGAAPPARLAACGRVLRGAASDAYLSFLVPVGGPRP
jgi:hypothetical protein